MRIMLPAATWYQPAYCVDIQAYIGRYLPRNHLVSVVSMLGPSPDWIVGASALEMCLANCTWLDNKVANRAQCCIH